MCYIICDQQSFIEKILNLYRKQHILDLKLKSNNKAGVQNARGLSLQLREQTNWFLMSKTVAQLYIYSISVLGCSRCHLPKWWLNPLRNQTDFLSRDRAASLSAARHKSLSRGEQLIEKRSRIQLVFTVWDFPAVDEAAKRENSQCEIHNFAIILQNQFMSFGRTLHVDLKSYTECELTTVF